MDAIHNQNFAGRAWNFYSLLVGRGKSSPNGTARATFKLPEVSRMDVPAVFGLLDSRLDGLTPEEAEARLENYGANMVAREGRKSIPRQLAHHLINPLNV